MDCDNEKLRNSVYIHFIIYFTSYLFYRDKGEAYESFFTQCKTNINF